MHVARRFGMPLLVAVALASVASGCAPAQPPSPPPFGVGAHDGRRSREAFEAALAEYDAAVRAGASPAALAPLVERIAALGAQRDAHVSRLYWYTDLEAAKAEAARLHRPIVSLRMLGRLDEEWSCANSRFFRTTLYPDPALSALLRDRFVLHWNSERPAPRVTIDFGDGRKVVRTVTGNSIHYVLDERGRPVDAIPGLYDAATFARVLRSAEPVALAAARDEDPSDRIAAFHLAQARSQEAEFAQIASQAHVTGVALPPPPAPLRAVSPPANVAVNVAPPKAMVERPVIGAVVPPRAPGGPYEFEDDDVPPFEKLPWAKLATGAWSAPLSAPAIALMRAKSPRNWRSGTPQPLDEAGFRAVVQGFERLVRMDTIKNEYGVHRAIHARFIERAKDDLPTLDAWVYATLFLTPASDPWLGLMPPQVYTGLPDDGLVAPAR